MKGSQRVLEAGVLCPWIDNVGTAQLLDATESIESRVAHDVKHQSTGNADEAEHRVVDDFSCFHLEGLRFEVYCGKPPKDK